MQILLIVLVAVALGIALPMLVIKRAGRRIEAEVRRTYGPNLRLLTGCGVVDHMNRVPGILGLLPDRLVYQAILTGARGKILLSEIKSMVLRPTGESPHRRVRKYLRGVVLEVTDANDRLYLFVVSRQDAPLWAEKLGLEY